MKLLRLLGVLLCLIYLANPSAGVWEILPDNLPFVGNIDEALVAMWLLHLVQKLRRSGVNPN